MVPLGSGAVPLVLSHAVGLLPTCPDLAAVRGLVTCVCDAAVAHLTSSLLACRYTLFIVIYPAGMLSEMKLIYDALPFIRELQQLQQVGLTPIGADLLLRQHLFATGLAPWGHHFLQGSRASAFTLTSTCMPGTLRAPCREVDIASPCPIQ